MGRSLSHHGSMSDNREDERLQQAARAAQRLVSQCRAHVTRVTSRMSDWTKSASSTSRLGVDVAAVKAGSHYVAFEQRIKQVESDSNAIASHLYGLEILMTSDTFYPLPAVAITRSISELCANLSWILDQRIGADERAARGYAALFRAIESTSAATPAAAEEARNKLIGILDATNVRINRAVDKSTGRERPEVAQVIVGKAHAKTRFQISQRIPDQIPSLGHMYSLMSGIAHGELAHVATSWETPDAVARLVGFVTHRAVNAWSLAMHDWVGIEPARFLNQTDIDKLTDSMSPELIAELKARPGR